MKMSNKEASSKLQEALRAMGENQWQDAIVRLTAICSNGLDDKVALGHLGFALSRVKRYEDAVRVYRELHCKEPAFSKWPYMIGYQYYAQEEWMSAIEWFDQALKLNPDYLKVLYRKGYAQVRMGQTKLASRNFARVIGMWERLEGDRADLDRGVYGKAAFQLGKLYLAKNLSKLAESLFSKAVAIHGNDQDIRYEFGKCLLANGKIDDAIEQLKTADNLKHGTDYVINCLAQALIKAGNFEVAEKMYDQIPRRRMRWFVLRDVGKLYLKQQRYAGAVDVLRIAAGKQRENAWVQFFLGQAYEGDGKLSQARDAYERAIELKRIQSNTDFPLAVAALDRLPSVIEEPHVRRDDDERQSDEGDYCSGVIDRYNERRGFGFICLPSNKRVFFHVTALANSMKPVKGQRVRVAVVEAEKGLRAVSVEPAHEQVAVAAKG